MTTEQSYYLALVVLSFGVFIVALAANYIRYRRWLVTQSVRPAAGE